MSLDASKIEPARRVALAAGIDERTRARACAYDRIYSRSQVRRVTIESFEAWSQDILCSGPGEAGHLNGNEISLALRLLGVERLAGKRLLDYCCGVGRSSIYFALRGAEVSAFDASFEAIRVARESGSCSGVSERVQFTVEDAQHLNYPDGFFDLVYCQSALHIVIDYPRCPLELMRVLKPGGRAVFCEEALGHNPLFAPVRWWRRQKYRSCGGRPLTYSDLHRFGAPFDGVEIHHLNLLLQIKTALVPWIDRGAVKAFLRQLARWDERLLARIPSMRRFCGKVVVVYSKATQPT